MRKLLFNSTVFSQSLLAVLMMVGAIASPSITRAQPLEQGSVQISQGALDLNAARPLLRVGSDGADVRELQAMLQLMGFYRGSVNGQYGEQTARAVSDFQQAAGIDADGVVGIQTWNRLFPSLTMGEVARPIDEPSQWSDSPETARSPQRLPAPSFGSTALQANPVSTPSTRNLPLLSRGDEGSAVVELQLLLQDLGVYQGEIDGIYGSSTIAAVERFQSSSGLTADGVVGPMTWNALLGY